MFASKNPLDHVCEHGNLGQMQCKEETMNVTLQYNSSASSGNLSSKTRCMFVNAYYLELYLFGASSFLLSL